MKSGLIVFRRRVFLKVFLFVLLLAITALVSAHAPLEAGTNEDLEKATLISNPEKSFVIYTELPESGKAQYYLFPLRKGQRLYGSLQVPAPGSMVPDLIIIGPGIEPGGTAPAFVQAPSGSGAMVIPGKPPGKPAYEPFSPQPIYEVARFNVTVPRDGNYYIAVVGTSGGKYSLAPGFSEEFTAAEWLTIPVSVITIHLWEGQSPAAIFAPLIIVMIVGLGLLFLYPGWSGVRRDPVACVVILSGFLYLGGAAMTALQIVHTVQVTGYTSEVILTLLFIAGPLILGVLAIRSGGRLPDMSFSWSHGVTMIAIGLLGLLFWAGLIIGPVLALISGALILLKTAMKSGEPQSGHEKV
jgi:hypothetical protein